jgi:hypothetical protein
MQEPVSVQIRRVDKKERLLTRPHCNSQDEQIAAALQAADTTPQKIKMSTRTIHDENQEIHNSDSGQVFKAREAVRKDPAVAIMGKSSLCSTPDSKCDNSRGLKSNKCPSPTIEITERDAAFRKMLQKLHKNVGTEPASLKSVTDHVHHQTDHDNHSHAKLAIKRKVSRLDKVELDGPVLGKSLDHGNSQGSAISLSALPKPSTWNPRAREFFSLTRNHKPSFQESSNLPSAERTGIEAMFSNMSINQDPESPRGCQPQNDQAPIYEPFHPLLSGFPNLPADGPLVMPASFRGAASNSFSPTIDTLHQLAPLSSATPLPLMDLGLQGGFPDGNFRPVQLDFPPQDNESGIHTAGPVGQNRALRA